ncbi:MAG TPA: hypothetical protein VKD23_09750 [Terriglobales bacterium]|nr:hypothetical protein [Terriglobales bacterium]
MIYQATLRYRIVQMLGGGGFGLVHKAKDARLHRCVALRYPLEDGFERTAGALSTQDAGGWTVNHWNLSPAGGNTAHGYDQEYGR